MSELRDQPPPPGYWPNTPNQFREATVDDCAWYTGAFAWQAASNNHINMHPVKDLREKSTDTVGGTPIAVMMRDTARLWPAKEDVVYDYGSHTAKDLRQALRSGAVVVVGGDYKDLPLHYRRWTNNDNFAHAIAIKFLSEDERTRMYDPLGGGPQRLPYDGEWIALREIFGSALDFGWQDGTGKYLAGIVWNRNEDRMEKMFLDPVRPVARVMRVKHGTKVYSKPTENSPQIKTYLGEDKWRWLYGNAGYGWRIAVYLEDGEWVKGYLRLDDIIEVKDAPLTPVTPCEDVQPLKDTIIRLNAKYAKVMEKVDKAMDILVDV